MAKRAVRGHGDAMLVAPGEHRPLDRSLEQVVEHLIAGNAVFARDRERVFEIRHVEVADAPCEDLAFFAQLLECFEGLCEGVLAAPVQEVEIDPVEAQAREAPLAGGRVAIAPGVPVPPARPAAAPAGAC